VTNATLEVAGEGRFVVRGPVVFATAGELLAASEKLFGGSGPLVIDLVAVSDADSAGLALLIEWLRMGHRGNRRVSFAGIPDKLEAIARLSGVAEMLAGDPGQPGPGQGASVPASASSNSASSSSSS